MNRSELIDEVARHTGMLGADVGIAIDGVRDVVAAALRRGEKVSVPGFLTAERVRRAERQGRNPQTGEPMTIPAGYSAKLTAGQSLKSAAKGS